MKKQYQKKIEEMDNFVQELIDIFNARMRSFGIECEKGSAKVSWRIFKDNQEEPKPQHFFVNFLTTRKDSYGRLYVIYRKGSCNIDDLIYALDMEVKPRVIKAWIIDTYNLEEFFRYHNGYGFPCCLEQFEEIKVSLKEYVEKPSIRLNIKKRIKVSKRLVYDRTFRQYLEKINNIMRKRMEEADKTGL